MGYTPRVLVVGGSATATGIARDLAMRGLEVTLVTRGTLAGGTTGHAEGLLHSGARLAAADPDRAARWHAETELLADIAGHCVEETGGFLAWLPDDDETIERTREACGAAGIPVESVDGEEMRAREPRLSSAITGGLSVPDATIDPFELTVGTAASAREYGATIETGTAVTDLVVADGGITHARLRRGNAPETEKRRIDYVINAAGTGAGRIAGMAGLDLPVAYEVGPAVVANERPTQAVVTRPGPPGGDRVVPFHGRSVLGAAGRRVDDPTVAGADSEAIDDLLSRVSALVPALDAVRVLRGWSVRRTVPRRSGDENAAGGDDGTGEATGFRVIDHEERDGLWGLSTVVVGTLTTHRLVAEATANQVCGKFGVTRDCLTGAYPLPEAEHDPAALARAHDIDPNPTVCACESVTRAAVQDAMAEAGTLDTGGSPDIEGVRVRTRGGMGECQGGRCAHRLAAELHPAREPADVDDALAAFFGRRWAGQRHALWGDQLAEAARTYTLHTAVLNRDAEPGVVDLDAFESGTGDDSPSDPRGRIP